MKAQLTKTILKTYDVAILADKTSDFKKMDFSDEQIDFIKKSIKNEKSIITINNLDKFFFIIILNKEKKAYKLKEEARKKAYQLHGILNNEKIEKIIVKNEIFDSQITSAFAESLILSTYSFTKYFTKDADKKNSTVKSIKIYDKKITQKDLDKINTITEGVFIARDLVNEPFSGLNSVQLAEKITNLSKEAGFNVEVLNKKQIEALKMGGLLAVNKASRIPPTFSIIEWKPENAKNKKPIILVGKGIVFDTGGYNLKPGEYMNDMKQDMGGAAAVIGALYAIAKLKMPVYVIGLVPSTDNLIGKDGYVTGDVLTMHNGMTVEVRNTDAEGRLILADALSYAQKYKPELVIDMATLTGAAIRAIGELATAMMSNTDKKTRKTIIKASKDTYERIVEFPMWEEYGEQLKSDIADIKNLGGPYAGQITAAKFLEHFTAYKWIHLDIAPTAFKNKKTDYHGIGGTGVPIRLLINFIEKYI